MSQEPVLKPEEVQEVLAGGPPPPPDAVQPYSLREPLAIPPAAVDLARRTLGEIVATLDRTIRARAEIELKLDDLQQHTAAAALATLPPPVWVAGLERTDSGGIALALHPGVALALVDSAMGGAGAVPEEPREPTQLEGRVLQRLLAAAAGEIGRRVGTTLTPATCRVGAVPRSIAAPGETLAVGLLRFHIGEGDHASLLLCTAALLTAERPEEPAPDRAGPGPLAPLLERVPLAVRPVLDGGRISLHDVMALEPGKVLRLDAPEDSRFDLRAQGHGVARGRIVRGEAGSALAVERTWNRAAGSPEEVEE